MKYIRNTPWRSAEDRSDILYSHTIIDSDGGRLARVMQQPTPVTKPKEVTRQKEAATAKLLAAAPELHTKLLECVSFLEQERRRIDRAINEMHEFLVSIEGEFAGEEFEVPPLKVNPAAIEGRLAFLESMRKKPSSGED
ncbi:hypothetical protein [Limnohabitans sp. JirII-31]|jgi:hypothetical protein|uniref:hypothetical protein n=1 Tax=Limnohabitans sp. JirII-31 TaxID=1977908 RepID=UPI000C1E24D5|nr:hypothetical protein [Limnohabitans sp. JirII-31]PIT76694.1 hypothetical protein B9Z41_10385 [Limnohabitans sp. JirII-31]